MTFHLTIEEAKSALQKDTGRAFTTLFQHGTLQVEYYAPQQADKQQPHRQDELYVIASGHAVFNRNGDRAGCKQGDILFVPAGMQHCFENFSHDFATWVIFYGKDGGEMN